MIEFVLILVVYIITTNARTVKSSCKALTDNCNNWCDGQRQTAETHCDAKSNSDCWIAGFIIGKNCNCDCEAADCSLCNDYGSCDGLYCRSSTLSGECTFDSIVGAPGPTCSLSTLDPFDDEIAERIGWNLVGTVLGTIPGIGFATQILYDVYGETNFISTSTSQVNALSESIVLLNNELLECMDSKISNLKLDINYDTFKTILAQFDLQKDKYEDDLLEEIAATFRLVNGKISALFAPDTDGDYEDSYSDFLNMLTIHKKLVTLWAIIADDQLNVQRQENDCLNFGSDLSITFSGFSIFRAYIDAAKESIKESLIPPTFDGSGYYCFTGCDDDECWATQQNYETINHYYSIITDPTYWDWDATIVTSVLRDTKCSFNIPNGPMEKVSSQSDIDPYEELHICSAITRVGRELRDDIINNDIPIWEQEFYDNWIQDIDNYVTKFESYQCGGTDVAYYIIDGAANINTERNPECHLSLDRTGLAGNNIGVRCCDGTADNAVASTPSECKEGATWFEAEYLCESEGLNLCTKAQLEYTRNGVGNAATTGCNFDGYHVWVADLC